MSQQGEVKVADTSHQNAWAENEIAHLLNCSMPAMEDRPFVLGFTTRASMPCMPFSTCTLTVHQVNACSMLLTLSCLRAVLLDWRLQSWKAHICFLVEIIGQVSLILAVQQWLCL